MKYYAAIEKELDLSAVVRLQSHFIYKSYEYNVEYDCICVNFLKTSEKTIFGINYFPLSNKPFPVFWLKQN